MSFSVHCWYHTVRYGKKAGQQNNQHDDPILTSGYMWGSDLEALMSIRDKSYHQHNYQVKFTQENKEWRGRIVLDIPNYLVVNSPAIHAHAYFFVVAPRRKQSPSLTSDTEEQVGDPTTITITVTNPDNTQISTTAPPNTTVQTID